MVAINVGHDSLLKAIYDEGAASVDTKAVWLKLCKEAADHAGWDRKLDILERLGTMPDAEVEAFVFGLIRARDKELFLSIFVKDSRSE